ncbi:hypothetical protein FDI40_gp522 [Agrobacterium phage Atu_ph07]|uniref:Uncharacterized protein n=1 Tax=Agrobacterium phage Atu_ph07 TaxID=2024264 RepID=A0A2L0V0I4_9CAUD|nr:hypothetical protein FDI40_gp522 [Agrobacterium phage Atu_ph07]AUZ95281.1 hypothetical protein [Agrobacterium phage Atu_ph07]
MNNYNIGIIMTVGTYTPPEPKGGVQASTPDEAVKTAKNIIMESGINTEGFEKIALTTMTDDMKFYAFVYDFETLEKL